MKFIAKGHKAPDTNRSLLLSTAIAALACAVMQPARAQSVTGDIGVTPGPISTTDWNVGDDLFVGDTVNGALTILGGGTVENIHAVIGNEDGVSGTAIVSGGGSIWTSTGVLYVGADGAGMLTIEDGGEVISTQNGNGTWSNTTVAGMIALNVGSTGTVIVTGAGSNWGNVGGDLVIGQAGDGELNIEDGATVDNNAGWIGAEGTSLGAVKVSGEGSTWTNRSALFIGEDGQGALDIEDGGMVSSNGTTYIGHLDGTGTVTVSGISNGTISTWTNTGNVVIGSAGTGTLTIGDGGAVNTADGYIADTGGGTGTVIVSGVNANGTASTWTSTGSLNIGERGTGTLNILAGGQVSNVYGIIGSNTGGDGHVLVSGSGSLWENTGTLRIGAFGAGALLIEDGATVTSAGATIGDGSLGDAVVTGTGTTWINDGALTVGAYGTGSLTIDDGAEVQVDGVVWVGNGPGAGTMAINGTAGNRGVLETSQILRGTGTATVTMDGGILRATQSNADFFYGFNSQIVIGMSGAIIDTENNDIGIAPVFSGAGALTKDGAGTLTLTGENTYGGGTSIDAGTLQLGDGGTSGSITGNVANSGVLAFNRSDVVTFDGVITGTGGVHQIGTGRTTLTKDNSGLTGLSQVWNGRLSVDIALGGTMEVLGGRLQGIGQVGDTTNFLGGTIAPGNSIGTLTIAGNYVGSGGLLEIETALGDDTSPTDLLHITGDTSGTTDVKVINVGGAGALTTDGIKIIDIDGVSNGSFALLGDYVFEGDQAVVAGAYAYRLYQNDLSTSSDGDWCLRSALLADPADPLLQAGVPIYETYAQILQSFNSLDTLQQRVGNRSWTSSEGVQLRGGFVEGDGAWTRLQAEHGSFAPQVTTSSASYETNLWSLQSGLDRLIYEDSHGTLTGGLSVRYGTISADIGSPFGAGKVNATGYGVGGSLTWYGANGVYVDGQTQAALYDSTLFSQTAGRGLVAGNTGFGYALSIETGARMTLAPNWTVTPQAQLSYSKVDFDDFIGSFGAPVSLDRSDSLRGRLGLSLDYKTQSSDTAGQTTKTHAYGVANIYHDFSGSAHTDVAGLKLTSQNDDLWAGIGLGGSYNWADDARSLYGEISAKTGLSDFGGSYVMDGKIGIRVKW